MIPAIILSAHTMALGVVRALGTKGVPVVVVTYDPKDTAQCSKYVTAQVFAPHPLEDEEGFIATVLSLSENWKGAVLFPVSDETLLITARNKQTFSKHFKVACPDYQAVQQVVDKQHTYPLAEKYGVPVPQTLVPNCADELIEFGRRVEFPCLLKPSQSHQFYYRFGVKMFKADNCEELLDYYLQAADADLEVMVQEFIPGGDEEVANYNAYAISGVSKVEFTADHVRNAPPTFGSPRVACSRHIQELIEPGRRLMKALDYTGYACTEFKRDPRDGRYKLMEVNGRHNLSTLLAVYCGINFPWLEYQYQVHGICPEPREFQPGVYWIDMTRDLAYSIKHMREEAYSPKAYLKPYFSRHVWAIFDWRDPLPFMQRIRYLAGSLFRREGAYRVQTHPEKV